MHSRRRDSRRSPDILWSSEWGLQTEVQVSPAIDVDSHLLPRRLWESLAFPVKRALHLCPSHRNLMAAIFDTFLDLLLIICHPNPVNRSVKSTSKRALTHCSVSLRPSPLSRSPSAHPYRNLDSSSGGAAWLTPPHPCWPLHWVRPCCCLQKHGVTSFSLRGCSLPKCLSLRMPPPPHWPEQLSLILSSASSGTVAVVLR